MNHLDVYEGPDGEFTTLPYHLPAGKRETARIERDLHRKGEKVCVISMRNALFMGLRPTSVILDRDVIVHRLTEMDEEGDVGTWMTSMPQEIEQHTRQLARFHGHVLVGGLGLGLAPIILSQNPKVRGVIVVDNNADVIELVRPYIPAQGKLFIVKADLFDYLRKQMETRSGRCPTFDCAFYDIWRDTSNYISHKYLRPLRKLSLGVVPQDSIECWNEDEVNGQIAMALDSRINIEYAPEESEMAKFKQSMISDEDFNQRINRSVDADVWPFLNWMRQQDRLPSYGVLKAEAADYMEALKDASHWQRRWAQYEHVFRK